MIQRTRARLPDDSSAAMQRGKQAPVAAQAEPRPPEVAAPGRSRSTRSLRRLSLAGVTVGLLGGLWGLGAAAWAEETIEPAAARPALTGAPAGKVAAKAGEATAQLGKNQKAAAPVAEAKPAARPAAWGSDDQAIAAAKQLGEAPTPAAEELLLNDLALGGSVKRAGAMLDALGKQKPTALAASLPLLSMYARHRNPDLRKKAIVALAALSAPAVEAPVKTGAKGAKAAAAPVVAAAPAAASPAVASVTPLFIAALSDSSSEVRAAAAETLGNRHEKTAEPALIKLLLRKDAAAPAALGQIGGADTARALGEMIGNVPDRLISETLGELLKRPDFGPDPLRVEVVKTLGKMPGTMPVDLLSDYVKDTAPSAGKDKAEKARPSRIEAQKIIEQRTAK
jgi:HEAT repeat protein